MGIERQFGNGEDWFVLANNKPHTNSPLRDFSDGHYPATCCRLLMEDAFRLFCIIGDYRPCEGNGITFSSFLDKMADSYIKNPQRELPNGEIIDSSKATKIIQKAQEDYKQNPRRLLPDINLN